jgi:hypothetical protein
LPYGNLHIKEVIQGLGDRFALAYTYGVAVSVFWVKWSRQDRKSQKKSGNSTKRKFDTFHKALMKHETETPTLPSNQ